MHLASIRETGTSTIHRAHNGNVNCTMWFVWCRICASANCEITELLMRMWDVFCQTRNNQTNKETTKSPCLVSVVSTEMELNTGATALEHVRCMVLPGICVRSTVVRGRIFDRAPSLQTQSEEAPVSLKVRGLSYALASQSQSPNCNHNCTEQMCKSLKYIPTVAFGWRKLLLVSPPVKGSWCLDKHKYHSCTPSSIWTAQTIRHLHPNSCSAKRP